MKCCLWGKAYEFTLFLITATFYIKGNPTKRVFQRHTFYFIHGFNRAKSSHQWCVRWNGMRGIPTPFFWDLCPQVPFTSIFVQFREKFSSNIFQLLHRSSLQSVQLYKQSWHLSSCKWQHLGVLSISCWLFFSPMDHYSWIWFWLYQSILPHNAIAWINKWQIVIWFRVAQLACASTIWPIK